MEYVESDNDETDDTDCKTASGSRRAGRAEFGLDNDDVRPATDAAAAEFATATAAAAVGPDTHEALNELGSYISDNGWPIATAASADHVGVGLRPVVCI